ncbi:hypothetical protein P3T76_005537 [Phytophthora citrophthora]|uniref:PiggyBac transposable element-derived protein 4 C-terminal zinc-ribbon domain-containing protein n=1 Tax=Phytophthora citrophthora TaxID=4793 RepID=A0AAD9GQW0_9STRA|nr:hypothetical protein P3T76_005537 [Phytophthora citrophthora]
MYEGKSFGTHPPASIPSYEPLPVGVGESSEHIARQSNEWCNKRKQAKRRQRTCKACSVLCTGKQRASTTTNYCKECNTAGPVLLCMRSHRNIRGVAVTCCEIWHKEWLNGKLIPVDNGNSIRVRRKAEVAPPGTPSVPGTSASAKRRRTSP